MQPSVHRISLWRQPARLIRERAAIPPQAHCGAKNLAFPIVHYPEAPPIRPERHVENSIATVRRKLAVALAKSLFRRPCCQSSMTKQHPHRRL
jgi:hypothetical protein